MGGLMPFIRLNINPIPIMYDDLEADVRAPERLVLASPTNKRRIHIGAYCYLNRTHKSGRVHVDVHSLCPDRSTLIGKLAESHASGELRPLFAQSLGTVFAWIDHNQRQDDLMASAESAKTLYRDYSIFLQHRINFSQVGNEIGSRAPRGNLDGPIASPAAARYQQILAFIIAAQHSLGYESVRCFWGDLDQHAGGQNLPKLRMSDAKLSEVFTAHCILLKSLAGFLKQQEKSLPLRIPYSKIGFDDVVFWSMKRHSQNGYGADTEYKEGAKFFASDGTLRNWEEVDAQLSVEGLSRNQVGSRKELYMGVKRYRDGETSALINIAIRSFCHILLAATGMNSELLASIDMSQARLSHSVNAMRLVGVKQRAGGEKKEVLLESRYLPYWRLGLELKKLAEDITGETQDVGIYFVSQKKTLTLLSTASSWLMQGALLPKGVERVLPSHWRNFKSTTILDVTHGDTELSSKIMGHSEETARRHYAFKAFEESAGDLHPFFEGLGEWAFDVVKNPPVPARVITGGHQTLSGRCDAEEGDVPVLIEGFDKASPEPSCKSHVSCFFCEFYGLHADVKDILTLLSIKTWLKLQTQAVSKNVDEHLSKFLPIIERIDVILQEFSMRDEASSSALKEAEVEVEKGSYTPYWKAKIDAMIDAGGF